MKRISDELIVEACNKHLTMLEACTSIGMKFSTFKRHAIRLGVYTPNQGAAGLKKPKEDGKGKISLSEILEGKHPQYQSNKLRQRLLDSGLKENLCEVCRLPGEWQNKPLTMHLDHINGNPSDHRLNNLRILCPNCHTQTPTYGYKKR